ncbi:MAG: diphthine--ammonia ligase [Cyclobacteriaceae bacterium]|nr:diphthine--ammonia ligase [Cyclobacteriaceae bacterium]
MNNAFFNWSGGKDSALALYYLLKDPQFSINCLFTSINEKFNRISMHGVRVALLKEQAKQIGIPLKKLLLPEQPTMEEYSSLMKIAMDDFRIQNYTHSIFGDIFLEDLKAYRDQKLKEVGIIGHYPLWKKNTKVLIHEFIDLGFKTVVVCASDQLLGKDFVGRIIDHEFINDLPPNVDPCGENGEFHTFVYDGPIFKNPIQFELGKKILKEYPNPDKSQNQKPVGFWFCDLI